MKHVAIAMISAVLIASGFSPPAHADATPPVTSTVTPNNTVGGPYVSSYVQAQLTPQAKTLDFNWDQKGQAGLLAIADIISYGGPGPLITPPEGWALIRDDSAAKSTRQALYWHIMNSDDPASMTWSFSEPVDAQGTIILIDNAAADSPIDGSSGNSSGGWMPVTSPITTTNSGDFILSFYATDFNGPQAPGPVFPDNVAAVVNEASPIDAYWVLGAYQDSSGDTGGILVYGVQLYDWVAAEVAISR